MVVVDMIPGLAYVNTRVGLTRLDQGLRETIYIPPEALKAQEQLTALDQQVAVTNRAIWHLHQQAETHRKAQNLAQQAQALAQADQQEQRLRKLDAERQRLTAELGQQRERTQEEAVASIFVDLHKQALDYHKQNRLVDCTVVILAAFRLHRQVYGGLNNPDCRMQVADMHAKLGNMLAGILDTPASAQAITQQYVAVLRPVVETRARARQALADAQAALDALEPLRSAPKDGDWAGHVAASGKCAAALDTSLSGVKAAHAALEALLAAADLDELFFPLTAELAGTRFAAGWHAWKAAIETALGGPLEDLRQDPDRLLPAPGPFAQPLQDAAAEVKRLRELHALGLAAAELTDALPTYRIRLEQLAELQRALPAPAQGMDAAQLVDTFLRAAALQSALQAEFPSYYEAVDASGFGRQGRIHSETVQRLASLPGASDVLALDDLGQAYALYAAARRLTAQAGETAKSARRLIGKALTTAQGYADLRACLQARLSEEQFLEVAAQVAAQKPGLPGRLVARLDGGRSSENERRRRLVDALLQRAGAAVTLPPTALPFPPVAPKTTPLSLWPQRAGPVPRIALQRAALGLALVLLGLFAIFAQFAWSSGWPWQSPPTATAPAPLPESTFTPAGVTPAGGTATAAPSRTATPTVTPTPPVTASPPTLSPPAGGHPTNQCAEAYGTGGSPCD